jgi:hypothetical protein
MTAALTWVRQSVRRDPGAWLIVAVACVTFFGVAWLGLYYDDLSNIAFYRTQRYINAVRDLRYNRFPLFALGLYPLMLMMPVAVAHLLVAAAHTTAAVLLRSVLRGFGGSERLSVSAALLFLVAPAHHEALCWVVASTVIFGVCFLLASTLQLMRGRPSRACALAFVGMLFTEAVILPAAALHGFVLLQQGARLPRRVRHMVGLALPYGAFLAVRYLFSNPGVGSLTQYTTGLSSAGQNATDLLLMATGLLTSRDINWLWSQAPLLANVGRLLAPWVLVPAVALMAGAVHVLSRLPGEPPRPRPLLLGVAGSLVGLVAALGVFLVVTGNTMQPRYTYVPLLFLAPLAALLLAVLDRGRAPRAAWLAVMVGVLGWSVYRDWSHVWANWYPARRVIERVLRDVEATAREQQVRRVFVVNAPRLVGNAYVFMREWSYSAAGKHLLTRPVELRDYPDVVRRRNLKPGERFVNGRCVFLGWRHGQPQVGSRAYSAERGLVFDCETGRVAAPTGELPDLRYAEASEPAYQDMMGGAPEALTEARP